MLCFSIRSSLMSTKQWTEGVFEMDTKIDDSEQDYVLKKILRPLILSLKFTGFNFSENDNKYVYFLRRICFSILLCFVIIVTVSKFIWLLKCELYFNAELVENIVSTIWSFQAMISLIFLIYWQMCKRIPTICQLLMDANGQEGIRKSRKRLFLKQSVFLFNHILFFIVCTIATIDSLFDSVRLNVSHSMWSGLIFGWPQLNFVVLICMIFMLFSWSLSVAFVSFLCDCMAIEFSYVNGKMKNEENLDVEKLDSYYNLYQRLSKVVEYADEAFRIYFFFMLCCDIPIIILLVYSLCNLRSTPPLQIFVLFIWLLFTFSHLLSMAIFPSSVNDSAKEASGVLCKKLNSKILTTNTEFYQLSSWFAHKIVNHPVGFNVWSFFMITRPLILSALSLIVTYLTLLIQFYPTSLLNTVTTQLINSTSSSTTIKT